MEPDVRPPARTAPASPEETAIASIRHEIVIDARPETVWDAVRDVGAVHERLLPGRVLDTRIEGVERTLVFPHGGVVRELIVDVDDDARRLAYAVVEGARPPLAHHHAAFQVLPEGADRTRLVWTTDVLPDSAAPEVRVRMERGAEEMRRTLETAAGPGRP
ncbi:SRPBCC family protein [Microbispora sp. ATCC PTA-5024]|uniref:SRPBCC family protein n=1 Tax=Microbispora sp. ATCC PTA-5024 TaxID=316330 RepID=UPI0003DCD2A8|nr:SRPBCC family protein [Microbispora sp. ATCC PTA-5024]ETK31952.1 polyketide cyclase [Microbispora sp. ATCC PTA-5024]